MFDGDNDGYADNIDILPNIASPGDLDNDGVPDENDAFPEDYRESKDSDGDGEGDMADVDDDNDGWTDIDEMREGTDPMSSEQQPIEGFEFILPNTQISLGAWDILGVLTGVPLGLWICVGLLTRTNRGRKYEEELQSSDNIEELNQVAAQYEYSLMWKMIGPHQALRLERMRTELERDKFTLLDKEDPFEKVHRERRERIQSEHDGEDNDDVKTENVGETADVEPQATEEKPKAPGLKAKPDSTDENGYEWINKGTEQWHRIAKSGDDWVLFESK